VKLGFVVGAEDGTHVGDKDDVKEGVFEGSSDGDLLGI